ncbi:predicted protein [Chaetomium globosum CBS 148.51]|uniref:Uncharacterized protein n=1 Tax=Chaetomium globosum (strain ATCC 6205 / CBS 148.51 / DSM 1962 / NBRC 6347 / NRRL 1970) TaxID=306901 RepID=Q2GPK0_CHAGB|nr:uncharacterized protein CHGG_10104 [Chaetomium globosum CBS 148.51]EAQ83700.1 predicted protein [Chaetomium globosum CBS 148.51]
MSGNQGNSASQTGGDQVAFDGQVGRRVPYVPDPIFPSWRVLTLKRAPQTTVTLIIQTLLQAGMTPQEIAAAFETAFTTHLNTNIVPLFPTCHVLLIQLQGQIAALRTQVEILQEANTSLQNRFVARGDRLMVLLSQMQDLRAQVAAATAAGWVPVVGNGGDEESFDEEEMDEDDETDEDDGTDNPHQTDNGDGMDRENGMDGGNETDGEDEMEENGGARLNGN